MSNNINEALFSPIRGKRTFEEVSAKIKTMIFKGILKPGDNLPSELQLARQLNVGRQSVREALRILELSGFISIQKGSSGGALIKDTILNTISNCLLDAILMGKITPTELMIARLEIEKTILKHVIDNADDLDIRLLRENIVQAKKKAEGNTQPFMENIEFHKLLAKASKNYVFVIVADSIMAFLIDFFSRLEPEFRVSQEVIKVHENILDAIMRKDNDAAITLLEQDIIAVGKRFQKIADYLSRRQ
jgi:DNA-binding FadR family transcriptional regulator